MAQRKAEQPFRAARIFLAQGQTDALGQSAVHLTVNHQPVGDLADIGHQGHLANRGGASLDIDYDLGQEDAVYLAGKGFPLTVFVTGLGRGGPLAVVLGGDLFGDHLGVGANPALAVPHAAGQQFASRLDGAAHYHLRAAAAGRTAVRTDTGVIEDKFDAFRPDTDLV